MEHICRVCGKGFKKQLTLAQKAMNVKVEYCSKECAEKSRFINKKKLDPNYIVRSPQSSKEEIACGQIIKSFFPLLESQYRIKNYFHAFDFYSPELQLLIEYDGTWWHNKPSQRKKDRKHLQAAKSQRVKLAVITDKEWKLLMSDGMPTKQKILMLLNHCIKN